MGEPIENVERQNGVLAESEFQGKIRRAGIEVKIAIFSVLVAILSSLYGIIDPEIGNFIVRVMLPTALVSIIVLLYKILFGYDPLTIVAIPFAYVAMLGWTFGESYLLYCSILGLFVTFVVKLFVFFFMPTLDREKNPVSYFVTGLILPLTLCLTMFVFRDSISQRYEFLQRNSEQMTVFSTKQKVEFPKNQNNVIVPQKKASEPAVPAVEKSTNTQVYDAPKQVQSSSPVNSGSTTYTPNKQKGKYVPPWQKNK